MELGVLAPGRTASSVPPVEGGHPSVAGAEGPGSIEASGPSSVNLVHALRQDDKTAMKPMGLLRQEFGQNIF